jgi:hypothetical protein
MTALVTRSVGMAMALGVGGLFRHRLRSRSDVKCAQRACRSQNRMLMRGGRP